MATAKRLPSQVITGEVRLSYLNVEKPRAAKEGEVEKYSASIIISKSDKATLARLKAAIDSVKESGLAKWGGKLPTGPSFKLPLRDGDAERPDDEAYANSYFINATSKNKPGLLDENGNEPLDLAGFYSGMYGKVDINFYAFNTNGSKGIACGLNNLKKTRDGEMLGGGRMSAAAAFGEDDDDFMS